MSILRISVVTTLLIALSACQSTPTQDQARVSSHRDSKSVMTYIQLGLQYMHKGNYDVALGRLQYAEKIDPSSPTVHDALGTLYQRLGDDDKAEQSFQKALSLRSDYSRASNNFGRFLCAKKRYEESAVQFRNAYTNPLYASPWLAYTNAGICELEQNNYVEADRMLRSALQIKPRFSPALQKMVQLSLYEQNYLSVRAYLQRYLGVAKHTPETLWAGVRAEEALGGLDAAASYALLLRGTFPDSSEAKMLNDFEGR